MDAKIEYRDAYGNIVSLDMLCELEPAWAANRIRTLLSKNTELEDELKIADNNTKVANGMREVAEQQVKELRDGLLLIATQSIHALPNSEEVPGTAIWMKKKAQEILTKTMIKEEE